MRLARIAGFSVLLTAAIGASGLETAHADAVADAAITARIETAYLFNEHLNPFDINTTTQDGLVTLEGIVENPIQKDLAERVAKSVEGVKQVVNNIRVGSGEAPRREGASWAASVADASTAASVRTRLQGLKDLDADNIQVEAQGDRVVLTGSVSSEEQKKRAEEVARTTRGVRSVQNDLQVGGSASPQTLPASRSDEAPRGVRVGPGTDSDSQSQERPATPRTVEPRGTQILTQDADTDAPGVSDIGAQADNATKTRVEDMDRAGSDLAGRADEVNPPESGTSAEEATEPTETATRSDGAEWREELRKRGEEARERAGDTVQKVREAVSDEWLEKRIEADIMLSNNLSIWDIDVEVKDGVATLTGTVDSDAERRSAERLADGINGIRSVENRIQVEPEEG